MVFTDTGELAQHAPTIQRIKAMNDLIREVEKASIPVHPTPPPSPHFLRRTKTAGRDRGSAGRCRCLRVPWRVFWSAERYQAVKGFGDLPQQAQDDIVRAQGGDERSTKGYSIAGPCIWYARIITA